MDRVQKARNLFSSGYNCAQSVVLAYANVFQIDESTLEILSAPFGGGIGRLREVCGAVSGAVMVVSLAMKLNTLIPEEKAKLYSYERDFAEKFREIAGSIVCRDLIAAHPHGDVHNSHKPACQDLVGMAVEILESMQLFGDNYDK